MQPNLLPIAVISLSYLLSGASFAQSLEQGVDALVSKQGQTGNHHFTSVQAAFNAASQSHKRPYVIKIDAGHWHEKVTLKTSNVIIQGAGQGKTVLEFDAVAGANDPQGKRWGTVNSASVTLAGDNIQVRDLTIANTFDYPANELKAKTDPSYFKDAQAVALKIDKKARGVSLQRVELLGYQDTLYVADSSVSYFHQCRIAGHIDFIFGAGTAVFDHCEIISRKRKEGVNPTGYITAPSTLLSQKYGLVFFDSHLTHENGVPANSVALGRPWHPTTTFPDGRYANPQAVGQSVFINTQMDNHLYGWDKMSGKDKQGQVQWFYPQDSRFFEYHSSGPGASINDKRRQLTDQQAKEFTRQHILQSSGWSGDLPQTVTGAQQ